MSISLLPTTEAQREAIRLVANRLLSDEVTSMELIGGGRNSQVYRLSSARQRTCVLKAYFRHPADPRDRLRTEFSSLRFLWDSGFRDVPRPLASDWEQGCALYEYIEGERIAAEAITPADIEVALQFLARLKELCHRPGSQNLEPAAEACFSIQAVFATIEERLSRFKDREPDGEIDEDLHDFLADHLIPRMEEIVHWSQARARRANLSIDTDLDPEERTLSPSDFGFHNALRNRKDQLVFLDFEYFGWDDPAKMVSDVLLHPGMHLGEDLKRRFVRGILGSFANDSHLVKRLEVVYPLFGLKWCLILLNEFLPEHLLRRRFASTNALERRVLQAEQLRKVRRMLHMISEDYEHFPYLD